MRGLQILAATLSDSVPIGKEGRLWQYHPRSDRHSKIACWGILFDLLSNSQLLVDQVRSGEIVFGINHEIRDFKQNRRKNLDLVLCRPGSGFQRDRSRTFVEFAEKYEIRLAKGDTAALAALPELVEGPVGTVHCALEAKACMTEHMKARPRLYDELNSSHLTIHGSSDMTVAIGFAMVNASAMFTSPTRTGTPVLKHDQPRVTQAVIDKLQQIPRRTAVGQDGFDAFGVVVVDCRNDGVSPVEIVKKPPAPSTGDILHYDQMIRRAISVYESRFPRP